MDDSRFDALARALAGPSRRGLLGAALAAALAPLTGAMQARRGPGAEGPCSADPRKERCTKDGECCTGLCDRGAGRCRCARAGQRCAQDRNCCRRAPNGPLTCQGAAGRKTCGPKPCPGGCGPCETCRRGSCVPDPAKTGEPCGGGKVCEANGACAACNVGANPCPAGSLCDGGACRAARCGEPGGPCRVFVTRKEFSGRLGGIAGADAECQAAADGAELGGRFRAWLSDDATSPATDASFTKASGPYVLPDAAGTRVADDWDDLTDGTDLAAAIAAYPDGEGLARAVGVWTNTLPDGTAGSYDCDGWSANGADLGTYGTTRADSPGWSSGGETGCIASQALYCFEQDAAEA